MIGVVIQITQENEKQTSKKKVVNQPFLDEENGLAVISLLL